VKPELLFLTQRIPYPPTKGEKIRTCNVLRHLAGRYAVRVGCLMDDPADRAHVADLARLCRDVHVAPLDPRMARLRCVGGLLDGRPLSLPYFADAGLDRWVARTLAEARPAVTFVCSSAMAQYVMHRRPQLGRFVMDFVDVDPEKWRAYAEGARPPMRWVYAREGRRLLDYDRRVAAAADASVFVSEAEAALFRTLAPESARRTHAVSNGVDAGHFAPGTAWPAPFEAGRPAFVFTGTMDYHPNVDAVTWFARSILPRVQAALPGARFFVVGASPAPEVQVLGALPGVTVTGRVPDVRPYLAHATAAVAPLRIARGIQNKVLEAMAMGRPVVVSPEALEGIEAAPGRDVLLATGEEGLARACVDAAGPAGPAIGAAGRRCVVEHYAWPARLAALDALLPA